MEQREAVMVLEQANLSSLITGLPEGKVEIRGVPPNDSVLDTELDPKAWLSAGVNVNDSSSLERECSLPN
jgi:hypothetical protein